MSIFGKKKKEAGENDFYLACLKDFHEEAKKCGVATKGVIAVPDLVPYGEKIEDEE